MNVAKNLRVGDVVVAISPYNRRILKITEINCGGQLATLDDYYFVPICDLRLAKKEEIEAGHRIDEISNLGQCNVCGRNGKLVKQSVEVPPISTKAYKFIYRLYLCQWHRAAKTKDGFDVTPIEFIPDEELFKANAVIPRA